MDKKVFVEVSIEVIKTCKATVVLETSFSGDYEGRDWEIWGESNEP